MKYQSQILLGQSRSCAHIWANCSIQGKQAHHLLALFLRKREVSTSQKLTEGRKDWDREGNNLNSD